MYVFTPKRGCPICHVLLACSTKHVSAGALIHRQQTIHWTFRQTKTNKTKLSSICRHKPFVTYWALKKRQALLTTCNFFFYFSVAKILPKSSQACGKRRKTLKF